MDTHRRDGIFKCQEDGCKAKFLQASSYYYHLRDHVEKTVYKCPNPNCLKEMKSRATYMNHVYACKSKVEAACDICGRVIMSKYNLTRHMVKVHKIGKLPAKTARRKKQKLVYRTHRNRASSSLNYFRNPFAEESMEQSEDSLQPTLNLTESPEMMEIQPLLTDFKLESEYWQPTVKIKRENSE